jgi:hypothetical protein
VKSCKITISGLILRFCQNEALKQNFPPHVQLSDAYWIFLAQSRTHVTVFSLHFRRKYSQFINQSSQITTHNILFSTEQIPNRQPQKRRQRSPSSTKAASDSAHGPVTPVFTPSLSSVLTVAASSSVYRDFNRDEPATISSTAHGFGLPLQSSLTATRRQRSPFFPIFNNSRRHLAVGPLHQQSFSSSSSSSTAAVQLIITSSRSAHHHHLQQQQATP